MKISRFLVAVGAFSLVWLGSVGPAAAAMGGGGTGFSLGVNLALVTPDQENMNTLQSRANTRDGGISASQLNNAYEGSLDLGYRFSGTIWAMHFRPAFFYQDSKGTGASGTYHYGLQGFSLFPLLRLYPLESDLMRFFLQFGLGYGFLNGKIQEGDANVGFGGSSYGSLVGLGAEFLFGSHALVVEGNLRYLSMERNIAKSASGTFAGNSLSQAEVDREVELDGVDFSTTMSGIQALVGYAYYF